MVLSGGMVALLVRIVGDPSWRGVFASSSSTITKYRVSPSFLVKIELVLALWTTGVLVDWAMVGILAS